MLHVQHKFKLHWMRQTRDEGSDVGVRARAATRVARPTQEIRGGEGLVLGPTGAKATQVEGINTLSLTGRGRELTSFRTVSRPQNT